MLKKGALEKTPIEVEWKKTFFFNKVNVLLIRLLDRVEYGESVASVHS